MEPVRLISAFGIPLTSLWTEGVVIASGDGGEDLLMNKRVFLTPTRGWVSDPLGPENK